MKNRKVKKAWNTPKIISEYVTDNLKSELPSLSNLGFYFLFTSHHKQ